MGQAWLGHTRLPGRDYSPAQATTVPAPTTTAAEQFVPTALPATGSSSPTTGVLAFGLLGVGILMLRFTRRAS